MKIRENRIESDYLEVFQAVTRLISSVHDPQQVMGLVVQRLPELLEVDAATIRLLDKATGKFVLGAACGVSQEYLSRAAIDSKEVMNALMQGQPMARTCIDQIRDQTICRSLSKEGIKSVISLPIIYKDEITGLLRLLTKDPREFQDKEVNFALSLAEQVGMALANGRMFQEMENQVQFLSELRDISHLVNSTLDLDKVLTAIVEKLPRILQVKGCTIRLLHPATNRLELVAASGLSKTYLERGSISREDSIFRVLKGQPVAIYNAANDSRVDYHNDIRREGIESILAVPIKNDSEIIGVLRLLTDEPHFFTATETHLAITVAEEGGNAIEKARTYRKITLLFNQIEEHERFLQTSLDSLWLQLLVVDPEKRVIMANKKFLETADISEGEALGQLYHKVVPWKNTAEDCPINIVLSDKAPITVLDCLEDKGNSNRPLWYERYLAPILGENKEVDFVIEAVRDITSEKLLEREQMEKMKLKGVIEMAGTAAHELNTPLFAALGTAQLLREDLHTEETIEEMDTIIRNMKKMAKLTREMTSVTGFEAAEYVGETKIVKIKSDG